MLCGPPILCVWCDGMNVRSVSVYVHVRSDDMHIFCDGLHANKKKLYTLVPFLVCGTFLPPLSFVLCEWMDVPAPMQAIVRGNVGRLTEENHRLRDQMEFEMQSSLNTISGSESLSMLREAHRSLVDSNRQLLSENARLREQQEDGESVSYRTAWGLHVW